MDDDRLSRLLSALDAATERLPDAASAELHADLAQAELRLEALQRALGARAAASPYLAFVRTLVRDRAQPLPLAASA